MHSNASLADVALNGEKCGIKQSASVEIGRIKLFRDYQGEFHLLVFRAVMVLKVIDKFFQMLMAVSERDNEIDDRATRTWFQCE